MSFTRANKGSVNQDKNISSYRSSGFLENSLSKSAANKMMLSLWTMGEDNESQDETDFKLEDGSMSFSARCKDGDDKNMSKGSPGFCMFNNQKGHTSQDRRGSTVESSSWGTGASFGGRGMQRKNSETIFNLEY
eukprot:TRINITY_DN32498_c0_g1_i1.p1 TRINITY_DN32498_c0_g1~~TRINITY_DN32498_c0_g1_i1.p1  ORF type:complete len:134 (-),score=37.56 TRINITY_DN32498_c0_g1_i1:128-529(-)